jgi:cell division protein FtsI (penicillin-binding protein 3)
VVDGGRSARTRRRDPAPAGDGGTGRTIPPRPARGADVAKPVPTPRRRPTPPAGRRPVRRPPRPPRLADPRRRLRLGTLLALALFATIGIRLVVLQVTQTPAYAASSLADRLRIVTLQAPRGAILDRSGATLAQSVQAAYIYADPTLVQAPSATAAALSPLLGIPRSELIKGMVPQKTPDGRPSQFEYLARGVDVATANRIMALKLPGIGMNRDERRQVPGGDLAANLIGFTGQDMTGLTGIEASYNDVLRGVNGQREFEVGQGNLQGTAIPGGYNQVTPAQPGSSLQLTIDRDLQYEVQRILSQKMQPGSTAAAVVLDVHTGEVLAQASQPTYSAAQPGQSTPSTRDDAATSFVVDPGSIHKAITFAAALQEGVIQPNSTVTVAPSINKGGTTFRDTHPAPAGTKMSLPGILAYSSNVGTITIADALGKQNLYDYQKKFGLGQVTGEGLPGEASGQLLAPADWSGSSYGSVPIGLSVSATPLQMAAAYAAIANDGTWVQPHLIRETIAPDGTRTPAPAPQTRQVISPANAAALRQMLEAVVTVPGATGVKAAIPGYRIAGKTGTGLRVVNGHYAPGEVASFIGMAPADNPRYVIAVFSYNPKGGNGGDITAPAFQEMMSFTLRHYGVPPTGTKPPSFVVYPR